MVEPSGLLEREAPLAALRNVVAQTLETGEGGVCALAGEAGAGKTSVLRVLARDGRLPVWWGACDPLLHPRPLGPLIDIAAVAGGELAAAVDTGAPRTELFELALRTLKRQAALVLIEDAHWADDATIDLLTHLGRRITATRAVLIISYRDDEIGRGHRLRSALTVVPASHRLRLERFSAAAVRTLAVDTGSDPDQLYAVTGGNPFFVTELLAAPGVMPDSVTDAVLARLSRLPPDARRAVECCSIVPWPAPWWLTEALVDDVAAVDVAVDTGLMVMTTEGLSFRHELARQAVLGTLPPGECHRLHRRALARSLSEPAGSVGVGRLAHHAEEAGDPDSVLDLAPLAAEEAQRLGSMRVAVAHLRAAVSLAHRLPAPEAAELWVRYARACYAVGRMSAALEAYDRSGELWSELGERARAAEIQVERNGPLVSLGRQPEADATLTAALAELEKGGDGAALAAAYARRVTMHMQARELPEAVAWAERARAHSVATGRDDLMTYLLVQGGVARLMTGDEQGLRDLRTGIERAMREKRYDLAHLGYMQIGSGAAEIRRYDIAMPALEEGIAFDVDHEIMSDYPQAWLARCHLELGNWEAAARLSTEVVEEPRSNELGRFVALLVTATLRARRADPGVWSVLDQARRLAEGTGHLQRLWPMAVARAEAAWIEGRLRDELDRLEKIDELARRLGYAWAIAEIGIWLQRAGRSVETPSGCPGPLHHQLEGRPADAVRAWQAIGCRYEAALAALDADDLDLALLGFSELDQLGAEAVLPRAAARIRDLGGPVPRRPSRRTRDQPGWLTVREAEIADQLVRGLTNKHIAAKLFLSVKTVEHHVAAVLVKLGVDSRRDVATVWPMGNQRAR